MSASVTRSQEGTENYSLPQKARHRKKVCVTLSEEAMEALEELSAREAGNKSATVEALILKARARMK